MTANGVTVVGAGYVGLATAVSFAHLGHRVTCVEKDPARREALAAGRPPFLEDRMEELLTAGLRSGHLSFVAPETADYSGTGFVFLCLPTPQAPDGSADLSALFGAIEQIAPQLRPGSIVVDKSTVPVGTARTIIDQLDRPDVGVVSNPEFLQEGAAIDAFLRPDRLVIGADDPSAAQAVAALYAPLNAQVMVTGLASAELAKYACNSFLATKLSFVNAIAALCDLTGADVGEVTAVMGADRRIGTAFLRPGPGWGGSCFPKDTSALVATAARAGFDFGLLRATLASNRQSFDWVVSLAAELCDGRLEGRRVAAWGLTFKAGTDDLRDSPALEVIGRLQAAGASVVAHDPVVDHCAAVPTATDPYQAAVGADLLIVLTEWPVFATHDLRRVADVMSRPVVLDTRGLIDPAKARAAGLVYRAIGRAGGAPARVRTGDARSALGQPDRHRSPEPSGA
jgi:UDPglucose 6-dehydrogenase